MMPEEWPIAASSSQRSAPSRAAGAGRLSTVRADFFLDPGERLTEQERALMTAMLHCLVSDIAADLRAGLPRGWLAANDEDAAMIDALTRAGLLDEPALIALLLRRADEERIGTACRARSGRREPRSLQALVSSDNGAVSAAAMALIVSRGGGRDRFGQCLVAFDDLSPRTADRLVHAVAAALRGELVGSHGEAAADAELSAAAAALLSRHEQSRGVDALLRNLVILLEEGGALTDDLLLDCAQDGEIGLIAEALGRRASISGAVAFDELLSGNPLQAMALLRMGGMTRAFGAGLLAAVGDLLGLADPGAAIGVFDTLSAEEVHDAAAWLRAAPAYRSALGRLGAARS